MRTFYVKRADAPANTAALDIASSVHIAVDKAKAYGGQLGDLVVRDALGGLRAEIDFRDGKFVVKTTR